MSSVTPMLSVYDGRQCGGFVLARGRASFEAFDATEHSLGGGSRRRLRPSTS